MLTFPNPCRSYDEPRHNIRFSGYDGAFEIAFRLEVEALPMQDYSVAHSEADYLAAFDGFRKTIQDVAREAYSYGRKKMYLLTATDFK
jgi:hypothetical protein